MVVNFDRSTQAKFWIFQSQSSLDECRQMAVSQHQHQQEAQPEPQSQPQSPASCNATNKRRRHQPQMSQATKPKAQHFASGFSAKSSSLPSSPSPSISANVDSSSSFSANDQESLVQFHAHQIQQLVGPKAILPELRRSTSTVSTAIMIFRRFFLSNSVIDFHPRNVAAASALLAVKVDCDARMNIDILSHATAVIEHKARRLPLVRHELRSVSVGEIEEAERNLLSGLNYQLRCHHPYGAIRVLSQELKSFAATTNAMNTMNTAQMDEATRVGANARAHSPRSVCHYVDGQCISQNQNMTPPLLSASVSTASFSATPSTSKSTSSTAAATSTSSISQRALAIAQNALAYSDVHFLHAPGKIAVAAVAIALEGGHTDASNTSSISMKSSVGPMMHNYLKQRFHSKTDEQLMKFEMEIASIIDALHTSPSMNIEKYYPSSDRCNAMSREQAEKLRSSFAAASSIRHEKHCQMLANYYNSCNNTCDCNGDYDSGCGYVSDDLYDSSGQHEYYRAHDISNKRRRRSEAQWGVVHTDSHHYEYDRDQRHHHHHFHYHQHHYSQHQHQHHGGYANQTAAYDSRMDGMDSAVRVTPTNASYY